MNKNQMKVMICILICALFTVVNPSFAKERSEVVQDLEKLYNENPEFKETLDKALTNVLPLACDKEKKPADVYCWPTAPEERFQSLLDFFNDWQTFTPSPTTGMLYYKVFYHFCEDNNDALSFVEDEPGLSWTRKFVEARGAHMNSPASITEANMKQWKEAIGKHWDDYIIPGGGDQYRTFNEFFARELKKPRPVAKDENILAAPADTLVNMINSNLSAETEIPTKFDETLNVAELLNGSSFANQFIGGTAVSCILLPTVYHHFHSPITGDVVEANGNVNGIFFGRYGWEIYYLC